MAGFKGSELIEIKKPPNELFNYSMVLLLNSTLLAYRVVKQN